MKAKRYAELRFLAAQLKAGPQVPDRAFIGNLITELLDALDAMKKERDAHT